MASNEIERGTVKNDNEPIRGLRIRYIQCFLMFLAWAIAYSNRICISLVLVRIQEEQELEEKMTQAQVGLILSSFMWAYPVVQLPIGHLARIYSAKMILVISMLISGIVAILSPTMFHQCGWMGLCGCRIILGVTHACIFPCSHTLLSAWVPMSERSRLGAMTYSGAELGAIISLPITGVMIHAAGWKTPIYIFGAAIIVWSLVFFIVGSDSPATSAKNCVFSISEPERKYIESSLGVSKECTSSDGKKKTPWMAIFTSAPFWALLITHCGQGWGFYMLITQIPIYMNGILGFDIKENGLKSALPFITMFILIYVTSWLSDWGEERGVRRGLLRRLCNTIGHWGPALALIGICFVLPGDTVLPVALLAIAVGLNAGAMCGFHLNHMDLSLKYAGVLASFTNAAASTVSLLAPIVVGLIVTDTTNADQWKIVFFLTAGIFFLANLTFIMFGSVQPQDWDNEHSEDVRRETFRPRLSSIGED